MKILPALLLLLPLAATASQPADTVNQFYRWRLAAPVSGLPSPAQLAPVQALFTPQLQCLFAAARKYRQAFIQRFPADKPPLVDGDLFSSLFEGPHRFKVFVTSKTGRQSSVEVKLSYQQTHWQDQFELVEQHGRWLIADITFDGHFAFGNGGSLRRNLEGLLQQDDDLLQWNAAQELAGCK